MAEIRLPRSVITQKMMPHGWRTSPKPVLVIPPVVSQFKSFTMPLDTSGRLGWHTLEYTPYSGPDFEFWEYRFWCLTTWSGPMPGLIAECRCCGNTDCENPAARKEHNDKQGCYQVLVAAFALLDRDSMCVICDFKTTRTKWGVPLCTKGCQQVWCESEAQPSALAGALELVKKGVK